MTPFEAHVLIQQATTTTIGPADSRCPERRSINTSTNTKQLTTTTISTTTPTTESIFEEVLKSHRLNPNIKFKNESLLSTAIKKSCPNLLKLFLVHGADPNLKSYENGRYEPALITAVRYKSLPSVQILLEYGANLGKTNFYGTDAIFQAVHENAFEILECLLCKYKLKQLGGQGFHNHDGQPSSSSSSSGKSNNDEDYQERQQRRRQKDVPASATFPELSSSSSSSSTLSTSPRHQSITIQKPTTTKGKDLRGRAIDAVVLNREKSSNYAINNSRSSRRSKSHDNVDGDDDDHVLCPFYYALNYALSYPCKRESLARLLQSYYKCKCLEEIAGCFFSSSCRTNSLKASVVATTGRPEKDVGAQQKPRNNNENVVVVAATNTLEDEARQCWKVLQTSWENFSTWWLCWYEKSVPSAASYGAVRDDGGDSSVRRSRAHHQYRAHDQDHDPITPTTSFRDVDNGNDDITAFGPGGKSSISSDGSDRCVGGGEGNEFSSRSSSSNLFPYKMYKIQGKCHVIKENDSSSSTSSASTSSSGITVSPSEPAATTETRAKQRPSSSYVVLVGPLKLSCITREVIRDQIMLCGSSRNGKKSSRTTSLKSIPTIHTTTSAATNESTHIQQPSKKSSSSSESTVAPADDDHHHDEELPLQSTDYFNRMNFRKSLETLMMPSSLMDYILYRNINWSGFRSSSSALSSGLMMRKNGESELGAGVDDNSVENNELSKNIKLIKRDLELNINYFAIYIY